MKHKKKAAPPLGLKYRHANPFKTLYQLYEGDHQRILWALFFCAVKSSPTWIIPVFTRNVINIISEPARHSLRELWFSGIILFFVIVQNIPVHTLFTKLFSQCSRKMEARLRSALITRLQQLSISFHDDFRSGKLQSKLLRDVEAVQQLSDQLVNMVYVSALYIVAALITTWVTSPPVALFYLVTIPLAVGIMRLFRGRISSRTQEFRVELETMSARVSDMIEMIPVTRAHGVEEVEIEKMNSQLERVKRKDIHLDVINAVFVSSIWVTMTLFGVACLLLTGWMSFNGHLRVGDVVMYYGYFQIILGSVNMMLVIYPQLAKGFESIQSIGEVLECPDVEQNEGKREVGDVAGQLTFERVNFSYNGSKRAAIKNFTLEVKANECIAFVGESGSGKSTVMNLIIGFRRPTGGRLLLDGVDMETLDLRTFRRSLAVVSQNTILFSGSIRDNITYGLDDVSEEALRRAVRMAHAEDFINALPEGLDTMIGEHGGKLSGGQRQRIAIARALIRNPKVIIFDEATSALDVASERLVQQAMEELIEGRTTFIVAHRLSTIRHAHRIVVMKKGECVEVGSYEELLARKGEFHRLVSLQV